LSDQSGIYLTGLEQAKSEPNMYFYAAIQLSNGWMKLLIHQLDRPCERLFSQRSVLVSALLMRRMRIRLHVCRKTTVRRIFAACRLLGFNDVATGV